MANKTTQAMIRAVAKYNKDNIIQISVKLNRSTDKDIIDHLDQVDSKQGYIKDLIRKDIR